LPRSASRCATPKRCCSSTIARPSDGNSTVVLDQRVRTDQQVDLARSHRGTDLLFSEALSDPDSHAMRAPIALIHGVSLRKCCSARISVGAINAA
jgi:hypothetical protein